MKFSIILTTLICSLPLFAQPASRESKGWSSFLEKFDTNHDGQVSQDEFTAGSQTRFTAMDTNGDAFVAEDEFQAGMQARKNWHSQHKMQKQAHRNPIMAADSDQDQTISQEEWNSFIASIQVDENGGVILGGNRQGQNRRPHMGPMAELDSNQNSILEKDEFAGLFRILDLNSDGILTKGELPQPREKGFGGRKGMPSLMQEADANQDAITTSDEWTSFLTKHQREDGTIDMASLVEGPRIGHMTSRLDQNQNGTVELEEIQAIFDRMDHNGDGQVSSNDRSECQKGKAECQKGKRECQKGKAECQKGKRECQNECQKGNRSCKTAK